MSWFKQLPVLQSAVRLAFPTSGIRVVRILLRSLLAMGIVRASHRLHVAYHTAQWQWERMNRDSNGPRDSPNLANQVTYLLPEERSTVGRKREQIIFLGAENALLAFGVGAALTMTIFTVILSSFPAPRPSNQYRHANFTLSFDLLLTP